MVCIGRTNTHRLAFGSIALPIPLKVIIWVGEAWIHINVILRFLCLALRCNRGGRLPHLLILFPFIGVVRMEHVVPLRGRDNLLLLLRGRPVVVLAEAVDLAQVA